MPLTIQPLPIDAVYLIGAGEVIDSLAAAVRELAENALDAGATRVAIAIDLDRWTIRVADNGHGMSRDDLQQAARPHTTSKIFHRQDLHAIHTLGFRGEALHSLAQLAKLDISSYQADTDEGWCVQYDAHGEVIACESVAIAPGTIVTATQIFESWPHRREAMPSDAQQLRQIQRHVQHLALCHPHVTWTVTQGERDWFSIFPGTSAKTILPQCVRDIRSEDLQECFQSEFQPELQAKSQPELQSGAIEPPDFHPELPTRPEHMRMLTPSLYLLMGLPDRCHRRRADWIKVAVNGRMIHCPELEQVMIGAFRRTLVRDRYPVCVAHLTVPIDQVDWNRQPAKQEVYLHGLEQWQERIRGAIAHLLSLNSSALPDPYFSSRLTHLVKTAESDAVYHVGPEGRSNPFPHPHSQHSPSQHPANEAAVKDTDVNGAEADGGEPEMDHSTISPHVNASEANPMPIPLRAIAQVHQMYILAEHPDGLWLIEQHIAHERILYEQLCDQWQQVTVESPIILNQLSTSQVDQLHRLNLDVEPFGEDLWAVRSVPLAIAHRDDCKDALLELSQGGDVDTALVATACRTAIRNGTPLSLAEMQHLVNQWISTRNPRTCPHGRPIYLKLEESRLARFFRRHWVVGKSHGI